MKQTIRLFRQLFCVFLLLLVALPSYAEKAPIVLNNVNYQVGASQWVKTQSAQVTVAVDATLRNSDMAAVRAQILSQLNGLLSSVNWNVTAFVPSKDKSGLGKLHLEAEARILESRISGLQKRIKSVSKPGQHFSIVSMTFVPSLVEVEKVRDALRQEIFKQVKQELKHLNDFYPRQDYFLHVINFSPIMPTFAATRMLRMNARAEKKPMAISHRLTMNARVVLSSKVK